MEDYKKKLDNLLTLGRPNESIDIKRKRLTLMMRDLETQCFAPSTAGCKTA